jgi:hypothetical protein
MSSTATPITPILFNIIINPLAGEKKNRKKLSNATRLVNLPELYAKLSDSKRFTYPHRLSNAAHNYVEYIQIDSVHVCTPGGRGCAGKSRDGVTLQNRQVAKANKDGLRYNPKYNSSNVTQYGLIVLNGTIHYKDGKTGNISIPVESSGVVGVRTGASKLATITNSDMNNNNSFVQMIREIETLLLTYLQIPKMRETSIEMINAEFNLYSDKLKHERPKINDFIGFLQAIQAVPEFNALYDEAVSPWLNRQGGPCVVKSTFRSKTSLPTITISPYGRVEILGAKTFRDMRTIHRMVVRAYSQLRPEVVTAQVVSNAGPSTCAKKRSTPPPPPPITSISLRNGEVIINKKKCTTHKKDLIVSFLEQHGASSKGKKEDLCKRIQAMLEKNERLTI